MTSSVQLFIHTKEPTIGNLSGTLAHLRKIPNLLRGLIKALIVKVLNSPPLDSRKTERIKNFDRWKNNRRLVTSLRKRIIEGTSRGRNLANLEPSSKRGRFSILPFNRLTSDGVIDILSEEVRLRWVPRIAKHTAWGQVSRVRNEIRLATSIVESARPSFIREAREDIDAVSVSVLDHCLVLPVVVGETLSLKVLCVGVGGGRWGWDTVNVRRIVAADVGGCPFDEGGDVVHRKERGFESGPLTTERSRRDGDGDDGENRREY